MSSSEEKYPKPDGQLIQQLAAGLQSTSALIQGLLTEIRGNSLSMASFEGELSGLQRTVTSLNRVLQEGDGKESILTRVALLERNYKELAADLQSALEAQAKEAQTAREEAQAAQKESVALIKQEKQDKVRVRLGRMQFAGLIGPSILAFIISILAFVLK